MARGRKIPATLAASACAIALAAAQPPGPSPPAGAGDLVLLGLYREIGLGDLQAAIEAYRAAAAAAPGGDLEAAAHVREGICLELLGREEEAYELYRRAAEISPGSGAARERAIGEMAIFLPRPAPFQAGERDLEALIEEGNRLLAGGALGEAKERFRAALFMNPDNHDLQVRMASVCERLGDHREAVFYYNLAINSEPYRSDFATHGRLAESYRATGDYDAAMKLWQTFLGRGPRDPRAAGAAEFELGLLREQSEYPPGMEIPERLGEMLDRGVHLTRLGRYRDAAALYGSAAAEFPESYLPHFRLGALHDGFLREEGALRAGIRRYESALRGAPPVTAQRLRHRLASLYEELGEMESASYYIEQYFGGDIRPAGDDHVLRERIRKKRMWHRIRRMRE
ncbi:MAG: tetratricopeptide repeat protein [bacterium]|nr:tetratricopeptide repeat protein [bacterium]